MKNLAIIVAAGSGERFGGELPKQYVAYKGKPLLAHSIEAFTGHVDIAEILVVINEAHEEIFKELFPDVKYCFGGAERQHSVRLGLEHSAAGGFDNVLIHDAARPNVSRETISEIVEELAGYEAVVPVLGCQNSVRVDGQTVDRDLVKFMQTPQAFRFEKIIQAHRSAANMEKPFTDDAQVAEANGMELKFIDGDEMNRKITTIADVDSSKSFRTGMGFDVHAFEDGDHVTICGVKVPHTKSLKGHSDADVGLHAITDAILGAIGEGDIGEHFPPSDDKWKGADSSIFLKEAAELAKKKNSQIENVDVTIICEAPKLGPHKQGMKKTVALILQINPEQVNIKATTTEKLGFTGRGEGVAAQAVATISIMG